jgi:diguanylate cyclase (GGDEF)-like protein
MRPARPQTVLVIDDAPDIHDLVGVRLRADSIQIVHALSPDEGMALARSTLPDLILLDLDLPGRSGLEVCRELRADPKLAVVPVIFLTGTVDVATKVQAFDAGAVDYVTKPFDSVELRARVGAALRTKRYLDLLATRAQLDGLTGLWNRAYFDARLHEDVAAAVRYGRHLALLLIDVDHFKSINDGCGHPFGDLTLKKLAETISLNLRPGDVACRYGGDEFGVILREADAAAAEATAERVREAVLDLELQQGGRRVPVQLSIGFATAERMSDPSSFSATELLAAADRGLYAAKKSGRNRVVDGQTSTPPAADDTLAPSDERRSEVLHPGSRVGPYEVLELIAGGSMATVYRAYDPRCMREVALKVLTKSGGQGKSWHRFAEEARALEALDHPGIVRVLDHGVVNDDTRYLALELLTGRTVRERLFDGPLPVSDAIHLVLELLAALGAAHDKGIVHRDLKPENLFLVESGGLKVLDFGLAKVSAPIAFDDRATVAATEAGVLLGTVGYLAPEQARGQRADERSDLFSVGTILYELVSGKRAFFRDSAIETLHSVIHDEPQPIGHAALDAVLRRCLAKDAAARVASARELAAELEQILDDGTAHTLLNLMDVLKPPVR